MSGQGRSQDGPGGPDVSGGRLRMLHWNIHSWRDDAGAPSHETVAGLIRDTAPHVVSLVEVNEPWGAPSLLGGLAQALGYNWVFVPGFTFGGDPPAGGSGGFGNALLTTLPISAVQQWQIHSPPEGYDGTEPSEPRTVVCARITWAGEAPWVCGTHLPAGDASARASALHRLAALLGKLDGPWLACGDFNTPPSTWAGERRGAAVCPDPPEPTYPAAAPTDPIDYCLVSAGLEAEASVLRTGGSDHLPVLVSAGLRRP